MIPQMILDTVHAALKLPIAVLRAFKPAPKGDVNDSDVYGEWRSNDAALQMLFVGAFGVVLFLVAYLIWKTENN